MANVKYNMLNDVRARQVAKDLSKIAKEHGLRVKLPTVQDTVAHLMGHADWKTMLAGIGASPIAGPEDHELDDIALAVRRTEQASAIKTLGFEASEADDVLTKLRPTGRAAASVANAGRLAVIHTTNDYHPMRFAALWEELFHSIPGFTGSPDDVEKRLAVWAKQRPMLPIDREFCLRENDTVVGQIESVFETLDETAIVLDASAIAQSLSTQELTQETYSKIPTSYQRATYVHFGANAFPSPYRDTGVEGAYVSYLSYTPQSKLDVPDSVSIMLVCSAPFQVDNAWEDGSSMMKDDMQELRNLLRGAWFDFEPSAGETLADGTANFGGEEDRNQEDGQIWSYYLQAPATAALHAIKLLAERKITPVDAVPHELSEAFVRRLERTKTDDQFLKAAATNDERTPIIRYMGRSAPEGAVTTEYTTVYVDESKPLSADDVLAIGYDLSGYWDNSVANVAKRLFAQVEKHLARNNYSMAHARGLVINSCMRAIAYDEGAGSEALPEVIALKETINLHVDALLADKSPAISEFMPIAWLAATILNKPEAAAQAFERCKHFRSPDFHQSLASLADHLSIYMDDIKAGRYAAAMVHFTGDVYEGTELAEARQTWDRWWVPDMAKPITPELRAQIEAHYGPGI